MDLKLQDYKLMVKDIEDYLKEEIKNVTSGESERIIKDIEEIIKSWKESE